MIEIHLDGKPVTKLQAARAVANLAEDYEYHGVSIGEPDEDGWISRHEITVHGRHRAYGSMQPAEVSWPSVGSVPAAEAKAFAEAMALGVEIAELAEMIAAERDAEDAAAEPPAHDEAASPDRQDTVRRAVALMEAAAPADLRRYVAQTRAGDSLKADPEALRTVLASDAELAAVPFGTWKIAQQLLHAAGLPH